MDYITRQNIRYSSFYEIRNLFFESLCAAEQDDEHDHEASSTKVFHGRRWTIPA